MQESFRLITNIETVWVEWGEFPTQLKARALLLQAMVFATGAEPRSEVRGFGTDGAWEVFQHILSCGSLEYELTENAEGNPANSRLTFKDGSSFLIRKADPNLPLDIQGFSDINEVWPVIPVKTREYWQAPRFPVLQYVDFSVVLASRANKELAATL